MAAKWYNNPEGPSEPDEYRDALVDVPGGSVKGRGAGLNPGNRFEKVRLHVLGEHLDEVLRDTSAKSEIDSGGPRKPSTIVYRDHTRQVINRVDPKVSPEIGFDWTVNPYRGCEHGCIYCYARPYHEYLGFSSGLDFETRIVAKMEAPELLEQELAHPNWHGDTIMMSAIVDAWQPIEAKLKITRRCLEVLARCRNPVSLITRNRLILRDLDLIGALASHKAVHVSVSLTTLDPHLTARMEPRASSPADRLHTIRELSKAGVPVTVMVAPVIPGITDREVPKILEAAAEAGATSAAYVLLRLPYQTKALFLDWLRRQMPDRAAHVESLIRATRNGKLYEATWGVRMKGKGEIAEQIRAVFKVFRKRYRLDGPSAPLNHRAFCRPDTSPNGQMGLFESA